MTIPADDLPTAATAPPAPATVTARTAAVPQGRTRRLLHLGRAVGEMAVSAAAQGALQLARGQRPGLSQLMLKPANARRLAERLSTLRDAAMKLGQLMSMAAQGSAGGVLPPEFAELLGGLRDRAHVMPATQLAQVLEAEYGADWHRRFKRLSLAPVAAASIGQVHRAETHDGRVLALKVQYPGLRDSIASDIANIALLLRTPGLAPPGGGHGAVAGAAARPVFALLDFGATQEVSAGRVEDLRELGRAMRTDDRPRILAAVLRASFVAAADPLAQVQVQGVIDLMQLAGAPLRHRGPYDFGTSDLVTRVFDQGRAQFFGAGYARTPPPDLLFLQRKFAGSFLLYARLRARVDLAALFTPHLKPAAAQESQA